MPVKRRVSKATSHRITPSAVAAYEAGDYIALHLALGLKPWQPSPLPLDVTPLGVDQDEPPDYVAGPIQVAAWRQAQALQRELRAAVDTVT